MDFEPRDSKLSRIPTLLGFRASGFRGLGLRVQGFGISVFGSRDSGLGLRALGLGLQFADLLCLLGIDSI